jgi:hypothetical protein
LEDQEDSYEVFGLARDLRKRHPEDDGAG